MMSYLLEKTTFIARPKSEVFAFFSDAYNLERITPPNLKFKILTPAPITMHAGTLIDYSISLNGLPMKWKTLIEEYVEGDHFVDLQLRGPYKLWRHRHTFREVEGGTEMVDRVEYEMPFGLLGRVVHALVVKAQLTGIFDHRTKVIKEAFAD